MSGGSFSIAGCDFKRAGQASRSLKDRLKRIGLEADIVRRAMVVAYEAEMNVVIHAYKGTMRYTLDPGQIDIEVRDEGPGISDIDRAMQDGYSTAPAFARELGFGAGMGLPNIKRNSDRLRIRSTVGQGTQLHVTIFLKAEKMAPSARNSVHIAVESCRGCLRCIRICPTKALRVRANKPEILDHLCIDCGACIEVCEKNAIGMDTKSELPKPSRDTVLVMPAAFLVQFGLGIGPRSVLSALRTMGFNDVIVIEPWEEALQKAVLEYAQTQAQSKPVISPTCPAVINLIQMRFPSLIGHVAPFLSPLEAVQQELGDRAGVVYVAGCPSQRTALVTAAPEARPEVIAPLILRQALQPFVAPAGKDTKKAPPLQHPKDTQPQGVLQVTGLRHVTRILEDLENGVLGDLPVLELFCCEQACFGSPLLNMSPFVARHRWLADSESSKATAKAIPRKTPLSPRAGLRLDENMEKAIAKLAAIDETMKSLPGKDCALCGAPSCGALAEDVVLGRTELTACVHIVAGREVTKK